MKEEELKNMFDVIIPFSCMFDDSIFETGRGLYCRQCNGDGNDVYYLCQKLTYPYTWIWCKNCKIYARFNMPESVSILPEMVGDD
jgi:hypothetical protein